MLVTTEGIVLRQRKIANNRRMLTVFTKRYGKISAGTSLSEHSRGKTALALRPFTYADYDIYKGNDYFNINSAQTRKSFYSIGEDLDRFLIGSRFIEYLDGILEEEHARPALFDMTLEFLESLTKATRNYETLLYAFIVKTLRIQGIMPELRTCVNCGKEVAEFGYDIASGKRAHLFSISSGGVICESCAEREKTEGNALIYKAPFDIIEVMQYFLDNPIERFEKVGLKDSYLQDIGHVLGQYIDRYTGVHVLLDDVDWR